MMARGNKVQINPKVGWTVDNRGYIHGGFDTPVFEKVKQKHNSAKTRKRDIEKQLKSSTHGRAYSNV
jgi:hypothetical protein